MIMKISIPVSIVIAVTGMAGFSECKKSSGGIVNPPVDTTVVITPPNDPALASTIGFFGNDWTPKTFTAPAYTNADKPTSTANATVTVDMSNVRTKISKYLFGNNSNLWMGQIVDQPSLMSYIKDLSPNIIRAPAGSVSDVYFFNSQPNQKPADVPDSLYDTNGNKIGAFYWSGKNTEGWTFALDNYYQLLAQTNSTGIITVNYGYARYGTSADPVAAAAHLAADWVRYDNGRTKFWEIGNESNGVWESSYKIDVTKNQDGQPEIVTGELYGNHFKVFVDSMKAAALSIGKTIYIGAQLLDSEPQGWQTTTDKTWNQGVLTQAGTTADFFIVHNYFTAWHTNAGTDEIISTGSSIPTNGMAYLKSQMTKYGVPVKPVAMTEWNIESEGSKQKVSNISGLHAVVAIAELMKNEFGQASRWDLANGWSDGNDHGLFNSGDEPGAVKWNPRPAFYYLYYLQKYFGDKMVSATVSGDNSIISYASSYTSGQSGIVIINKGAAAKTVAVTMKNFRPGTNFYWHTLAGGGTNEFSGAVTVNNIGPSGATGGPINYTSIKANAAAIQGGITVSAPPRSAIFIAVENKK